MNAFATLVQSTIGQKVVMAVSGLVMVGWLFLHMSGNMLVFAGPESFNHYAEFIQSGFGVEPALLWALRFVMLAAIGAHIWAAVRLSARNRSARPSRYAVPLKSQRTSYAARFMLLGGITLLTFLVFHLAHLTVGVWSNSPVLMEVEFSRTNAYRNLVVGLSNPLVGAFYILANIALGAHLFHGVSSGLQTLGLNHPRYERAKSVAGYGFAGVIAGGNIVIALSVLGGIVPSPF